MNNEIKLDSKATNYLKDKIGGQGGTTVVANPTLSGDEESLTGLEVDGVKYVISSSGPTLYQHNITLNAIIGPEDAEQSFFLTTSIITTSNTPLTLNTLVRYLYDNGFEYNNGKPKCINASGSENGYVITGVYNDDENDLTKLGICYDDQMYELKTDYITQKDLDDYNGMFEDIVIQLF